MKKILLSICIILSINSFAQSDSARLKINATIQARDCEVVLFFTKDGGQRFEDLDSTLLTKWRPPAVAPTGTTPVSINDIEVRAWLQIWRMCSDIPSITAGGTTDRIGNVLKLSGHSWLVNRITKDESDRLDMWTDFFRRVGRRYGKKETTGFE